MDTAPTDATLTRRPIDAQTLETGRAVAEATAAPDAALGRRQLPRVLHDAPAAILLVELPSGRVVQASANAGALIDGSADDLLGQPLAALPAALLQALQRAAPQALPEAPAPLQVQLPDGRGATSARSTPS